MFDYSYNFYFPEYTRPDGPGYGIGVENWPFNPELKYTKHNWCNWFHGSRFTLSDTGYVEDNGKQINYHIHNTRPDGYYYYYVDLNAARLGELDFFRSSFKSNYATFKLPAEVEADVLAGRCKVVLDNTLEGFPDRSFNWETFYKVVAPLKPTDFVFVTGDISLAPSENIPTVYRNSWERSMSTALLHPNIRDYWSNHMYATSANRFPRPWKCLALNRLMRPHRIMIAKLIDDRELGSQINYSFGIVTHHGSDAPDALNRIPEQVEGILEGTSQLFGVPYELLEDFINEHGEKNIAQEDGLNLHVNQAINYENAMLQAYNESYFSLVAETNYHQKTVFQSEKIFKPIMMLQPFVTAAEPGAIQAMRDLGYDVFDDYINHSYDTIEDPMERMLTLFDEVERLCAISHEEWADIRFRMLPRNQMNLTVLRNASFKCNELHKPTYRGQVLEHPARH